MYEDAVVCRYRSLADVSLPTVGTETRVTSLVELHLLRFVVYELHCSTSGTQLVGCLVNCDQCSGAHSGLQLKL